VKIDWKAVKIGYQNGGGAPELAERHGCSAETVRRRARKENWRKKGNAGCAAGADGIDAAADHRTLLNGVRKRLVKGLENADLKLGLEELKVAKTALEVLSDYRKEEEHALGPARSGRKEMEDCHALASEMAQATAPSGADEALERE